MPRRGDGDRPRGRGDDPDLERLGLLLPRLRVHERARLRAGLGVVRPDRRVRRSLPEPLHARLLPGRVRRGRALARPLARGGGVVGGLDRGLLALAPRVGGGPTLGLAELRRRQGREQAAKRLLERAGPSRAAQLCRARMALDRGDARRAAELVDRVLAGRRRTGGSTARRRSSCSSGRAPPAASSSGRRARWRSSERSRASWAPRRCGPARTSRRRPCGRPAATTSALGPCSRTRSTDTSAAAPRSRPPPPGSSSPRASSRWVIPGGGSRGGGGARRPAHSRRFHGGGAGRRHPRRPRTARTAAAGTHAQGARGAAPARRGAHEPARSPSAW